MGMTIPELIEEWRRMAKACGDEAANEFYEGHYDDWNALKAQSNTYTRCADDLEKAGAGMGDDAIIEYVANHKNLLNRILYRHDEITERRREEIRAHPPRTGEGV